MGSDEQALPVPNSSPRCVEVQRLRPEAELPKRMSELAAGYDLAACFAEGPGPRHVILEPGEISLIPTGVAIALPAGYEGQIRPRSGLALRHGISIPNAPGTIDADYRGELKVILINLGREPFRVEQGDRIAQLVVAPVAMCSLREVEALTPGTRGDAGFGSTGRS